ncbi:MAG: alpha/beta hydrolase [Alphaproteobacteria bacterium]|nr:alpha/beta hydrolase [Alphaproteobacteria bacterium]
MQQPAGPLSGVSPRIGDGRFHTRDGLSLPLRCWKPVHDGPRAVVLALHGFNDYANAFETAGRHLAERGHAVYAYDQRGFGASPHAGLWAGTGPMVRDLGDAVAELRRLHPGVPLFLLGDSMGGAVVMTAAAGPEAPKADGLILVAPAVWGRSTMPLLYRTALFLTSRTVPWLRLSGRGLNIMPSDNIEMLRALGRDPLIIKETRVDTLLGLVDLMDEALASASRLPVPALLLYGEKDEVIPKNAVESVVDRLPRDGGQRRVALYPDGYHMLLRDLKAEVALDDIASWIAAPDAPLPSGADRRSIRSR